MPLHQVVHKPMPIASKPARRTPSGTGPRPVPASAPRARERYAPGELIDKYQLVRTLGSGGVGTVWVAHDLVLDVNVALKLIALNEADALPGVSRLVLDEARAAARLGHSAIVRVHDFGQTQHGDPFIAMELLEGDDLATVLSQGGALRPEHAVQILLPIADALATAHEQNIVHRDVKPENIFLARVQAGISPKLLDFGIARRIDNPRRSIDGAKLGTPDYMSPEQVCGESIAPASDIWSFCIVLYELVTLRCPFSRPDHGELFRAIVEDEPQSFAETNGVDPALWRIARRGLEKEPSQRWGSMRELGDALASWLIARGVREDATGTTLKRSWLRGAQRSSDLRASGTIPRSAPGAAIEPSPPNLEAIAELNRGGDPLVLLEREARRRALWLSVFVTLVILVFTLALLMGTGIVEL